MVLLYIPDQPWKLALVICLLDAYDVPHFVHNFYLGSLFAAYPQIDIYNLRRVYVPAEVVPYARQLLEDFFPDLEATPYEMSGRDKVRVVLECLVGGWFIPGSKWSRGEVA